MVTLTMNSLINKGQKSLSKGIDSAEASSTCAFKFNLCIVVDRGSWNKRIWANSDMLAYEPGSLFTI